MAPIRIILISLLIISKPSLADKPLSFGIVPQQSAERLAKQWLPILQYISKEIGQEVRFATKSSIPLFEKELSKSLYDISYMNPYHYTVFSESNGYIAITKAEDKKIKGIIVVKKDSGISTIQELAGKKLAFPSPDAFAASLLTQGFLGQNNINIDPVYVRSHDSVYHNIAQGNFVAGGGIYRTLNAMQGEVSDNLIVLWESQGYTPHAIAVSPHVPQDVVERIQQAIITLDDTHPELLSPLKIKGFEQAKDSDWDDVRQLFIEE
ncbi:MULTISPECIES: phosphate/phosphite/phosphonate ABC transporter substrate-binding protein [Vibrio]|uniref:phosphate/phosphite/phosphonate ABC transporter substrate-binding protein n=1 Tax=Vibrio TaxID=662 RepID=UPI0002F177B6|nr:MULTISPECIES: phosphate/phosphite/phosphonate ABC transporter substrate-binding protein [Vibrio]MCF7506234.1 phosphate/phosphite/phosphonate ABC transporter substrate-binding protein [Vibrio sp. L3-7]OEF61254.1 phosphate ABC transporter substrate-binding protein [Vibrio tasmaniensis 1F-187]